MNDWKTFEWINLPFADYEVVEGETRYYIVDGIALPSMTSLLKVLDDKGLDAWRKSVGNEQADKIVAQAVARGNSLHDLSERYLQNVLERKDVLGPGTILFNRNRKYLNELGPIVAIEAALFSKKYKYAGRVDCIAFEGKDLCIVDHKNSRKTLDFKKKYARRKIMKYMIQCAGYAVALHEMFPTLPMAKYGILIFANLDMLTTRKYKFELAPLVKEVELLSDIYHNGVNKKESAFYKL